jgi:predicted dehydrogenase
MINIGVIGYGYWGPNVVRNFNSVDGARVVAICDRDGEARKGAARAWPAAAVCADASEIVTSPSLDAVAVITPVSSHFELARMALRQGKHIFVEKPFTAAVAQAEELIELAERKHLNIMVDHTFLFTGAVRKMKELIDDNVLGKLYYFDSTRVNLGLFQHDINVLWDLAPHDLSIMNHLIPEKPSAVVATGGSHFNGLEDIAYLTIYFPDNMIAHINVNWMSPVKVRTTLIGGQKKMLVWNDLSSDEKIKVYDKGVDVTTKKSVYDLLISYRSGEMWAPKISQKEALARETEYFIECIEKNETPFNDGKAGLEVVRMLEAANQSLEKNKQLGATMKGKFIYV